MADNQPFVRSYRPSLLDKIRWAGDDLARAAGGLLPRDLGQRTVDLFRVSPFGLAYSGAGHLAEGDPVGAVELGLAAFPFLPARVGLGPSPARDRVTARVLERRYPDEESAVVFSGGWHLPEARDVGQLRSIPFRTVANSNPPRPRMFEPQSNDVPEAYLQALNRQRKRERNDRLAEAMRERFDVIEGGKKPDGQ